MAHGGYRKPPARTGPSGPGKFSKRTDVQKRAARAMNNREPSLDMPDVQYGDVGEMARGERIAPVPRTSRPQAGGGERRGQGQPARPSDLPPFVTEMDSTNPGEPMTEGLSIGPGAGPEALSARPEQDDLRDVVLQFLSQVYNNADAAQMLNEHRARKARMQTPAQTLGPAQPPGIPAPAPVAEPAGPGMGEDLTAIMGTEEETSADTSSGNNVSAAPPQGGEGGAGTPA